MVKQLLKNSLLFSVLALIIGFGVIYTVMKNTNQEQTKKPTQQTETAITQQETDTNSEKPEEIAITDDKATEVNASSEIEVPLIQQMPELERGCEVTSLAMILQYNGINVDKMELASQITYVPFNENGLHGNMNRGFVGNMETFNENGLGVYVEPIIQLAKKYVEPSRVINLSGQSMESLYQTIDQGHPVWIITNSWFSKLPEEQFYTWQTTDGPMKVTYRQHSVVITNYDHQYVYVNDPLQDQKNIPLPKKNFEAAWIQMNQQAMYIAS